MNLNTFKAVGRCVGAVLFWLATGHAFGTAAPAPASSPAAPHRVLIILETSSAMRAQTNNLGRVLEQFLTDGLGAQLRPGDTVGVWTFNQQLQTGEFPLHHWSADSKNTLPEALTQFACTRKYEKKAQFAPVLNAMSKLITESDLMTVILVASGESPISGTSVDDQANQFFSTWKNQQQKAHMPFVIVLRGFRRAFTDFSLNTPPWQIEFPPLPPEVLAVAKTPTSPRPVVLGPSLIVSGRKPAPAKATPPATTAAAAVQNAATNPVVAAATTSAQVTNSVAAPTPAAPPAAPPAVTAAQSAEPAADSASPAVPAAPSVSHPEPPRKVEPAVTSATSAHSGLWILLALAAVASGLVLAGTWLYLRRNREAKHISLITQSLDLETKA